MFIISVNGFLKGDLVGREEEIYFFRVLWTGLLFESLQVLSLLHNPK